MGMFKILWKKYKLFLNHWKSEIIVLMVLIKHPEIPKLAKVAIVFLLSYIFSPIDLIPDFIPLIGHLDDFALIPITLYFIKKITPYELIEEVRWKINEDPDYELFKGKGPKIAAIMIFVVWIGISTLIFHALDLETYTFN